VLVVRPLQQVLVVRPLQQVLVARPLQQVLEAGSDFFANQNHSLLCRA